MKSDCVQNKNIFGYPKHWSNYSHESNCHSTMDVALSLHYDCTDRQAICLGHIYENDEFNLIVNEIRREHAEAEKA